MPTYPYACTACGHAFEVQQSFSDPALTECPECAGRLRKVFSSVGVVFKGSGFYRTDSRSGGRAGAPATANAGSGGGDGGTSGSGTTSGDSASTTPPAAKPAPSTSSAPAAAAGS